MASATYNPKPVDGTPTPKPVWSDRQKALNDFDDAFMDCKSFAETLDFFCDSHLNFVSDILPGKYVILDPERAEAIIFLSHQTVRAVNQAVALWESFQSWAQACILAEEERAGLRDPMLAAVERYRAALAEDNARVAAGQADDTSAERTITPLWNELRARPPVTTTFAGAAAALHHLMEDGTITDEDSGLVSSVIAFLERRASKVDLSHWRRMAISLFLHQR